MEQTPTVQDVFAAHQAMAKAEREFISAYTADPNRKGMRPGDFRYRRELHSTGTRKAGEAFVNACEAWRAAYRARNAAPRQSGMAPFPSPSSAKSWGLLATDGPYSFLAEEHGAVKHFTFAPDGPAWSLKEVTHER